MPRHDFGKVTAQLPATLSSFLDPPRRGVPLGVALVIYGVSPTRISLVVAGFSGLRRAELTEFRDPANFFAREKSQGLVCESLSLSLSLSLPPHPL